jgi:1-acyl-sn-glycerol-3-phosphate acyltransferase
VQNTTDTLEQLVAINIGDIFESLGLSNVKRGRAILKKAFRPPALRFAKQMIEFDRRVGESGLRAGSLWACKKLVGRVLVSGVEHIPKQGATLIVSNHPGLSDSIDLFAAIPRDDLRIIAAHRPFLVALPNLKQYLVYVKEDASQRMSAFRGVLAELRAGRAVLTFPAGKIEPDPGVRKDAARSLELWTESIGLLARLEPSTTIVPVIVSGVFTPAAYRNPIARARRKLDDRERFAAMLQVMWPGYQRNVVHVAFGAPMSAADLKTRYANPLEITEAIANEAKKLIESPPTDWQEILA